MSDLSLVHEELARISETQRTQQQAFDSHANDDYRFQVETKEFNGEMAGFKAETEGSLAQVHAKLDNIPTAEQLETIVANTMRKTLVSKGKSVYAFVVAASILIAAIVVIFGGLKSALGWFGFAMLPK